MQKQTLALLFISLTSLAIPLAASDTPASEAEATPARQGNSASTVMGKGPGMGRDYQKNVPGPGKGEPEHRGADAAGASDTGKPDKVTNQGKKGAGAGAGYPGYRGHGADDSPGHNQYGNPPRDVED